jgi:hypothetical protein
VRGAPRVERSPGAEIVAEPPQAVFDLAAHREGAMHAIRSIRRGLVFTTTNAHDTSGTAHGAVRLRLELLFDAGPPPRIRPRRNLRQQLGNGLGNLTRLGWIELDVHPTRVTGRFGHRTFEGFWRFRPAIHPFG